VNFIQKVAVRKEQPALFVMFVATEQLFVSIGFVACAKRVISVNFCMNMT
jgi:hypothetical protein